MTFRYEEKDDCSLDSVGIEKWGLCKMEVAAQDLVHPRLAEPNIEFVCQFVKFTDANSARSELRSG